MKPVIYAGKAVLAVLDGAAEIAKLLGDYLHGYIYHWEKRNNET